MLVERSQPPGRRGPQTDRGHAHDHQTHECHHQVVCPAAMPTTTAKITKAVSCVSLTTVRNRTTDSAPPC